VFGRATVTLGIGPHSSCDFFVRYVLDIDWLYLIATSRPDILLNVANVASLQPQL